MEIQTDFEGEHPLFLFQLLISSNNMILEFDHVSGSFVPVGGYFAAETRQC